ncbi:MAG: hypothetical protein HC845_03675 [Akkermansiaceae bacterium]|nr:hypothetical protein [Akkermansiaceae bacterium]
MVLHKSAALHEVVSGLDLNNSGTLEANEVKSIFEKTPRINGNGSPYSGTDPTFKFLDKIFIVNKADYDLARGLTQGYGEGVLILPNSRFSNSGALLKVFATGANTLAGTTTNFGKTISANGIGLAGFISSGLSLPVGGRWSPSPVNDAPTHELEYPTGSDLSNRIQSSGGFDALVSRIIQKNKAVILAAVAQPNHLLQYATLNGVVDQNVAFKTTDPGSDVHYALGTCKFEGSIRVLARSVAGFPNALDVTQVELTGSFVDLYDFSFQPLTIAGGVVNTRNCAMTQVGHSTLAPRTPTPDAGRVFFTRVKLATGPVSFPLGFP